MYAFASFVSRSFLLIKSSRLILFSFYLSLAVSVVFQAPNVRLLNKKLVPLKANAFMTAPPLVNNTDAILF